MAVQLSWPSVLGNEEFTAKGAKNAKGGDVYMSPNGIASGFTSGPHSNNKGSMESATARILDANLNRLREALRVVEEAFRFAADHAGASARLKAQRHRLQGIEERLDRRVLLAARRADEDVGRHIEEATEGIRRDLGDVLQANLKRAQEACRVLEEYGKLAAGDFAAAMKEMRFELYEIEQRALLARRFPHPCLYVLLTRALCRRDPRDVARLCADGGAHALQLREKDMEDGRFLDWIREVRNFLTGSGVLLIVNDRAHLARLAEADGAHLGQGDLRTPEARAVLGFGRFLGRSTHGLEQARVALGEGVDYIGVGPLFPTKTKEHAAAVGLDYLKQVQQQIPLPYVAIGSVNRASLDQVLACQPSGIAICSAIISADDPQTETRFYRERLEAAFRNSV